MTQIDSREAALDYLITVHAQAVSAQQRQLGQPQRAPFIAQQVQQLGQAFHALGVTDEELGWAYARVNAEQVAALRGRPLFQPPAEGGPLTESIVRMVKP